MRELPGPGNTDRLVGHLRERVGRNFYESAVGTCAARFRRTCSRHCSESCRGRSAPSRDHRRLWLIRSHQAVAQGTPIIPAQKALSSLQHTDQLAVSPRIEVKHDLLRNSGRRGSPVRNILCCNEFRGHVCSRVGGLVRRTFILRTKGPAVHPAARKSVASSGDDCCRGVSRAAPE